MDGQITARQLEAYACDLWPEIAGRMGVAPEGYRPQALKTRIVSGTSRTLILLRARRGGDLVMKVEYPPSKPRRFEDEISAHRNAAALLTGIDGASVPAIHLAAPDLQVVVMERVLGRTAHEALELADLGLADRPQVLRACGNWLGRFHEAGRVGCNPVRPDAMLRYAAGLEAKVRARQVTVPRRDMFLDLASIVPRLGEQARGRETRVAASHGDMHLRNLLIAEQAVYAIDFAAQKALPPGHDLARFLVRFGNFFVPGAGARGMAGIAEADLNAFWGGYGAEHRDDPALRYLLPVQMMSDWVAIPRDRDGRSSTQTRRLKGLLRMATALIAQGRRA